MWTSQSVHRFYDTKALWSGWVQALRTHRHTSFLVRPKHYVQFCDRLHTFRDRARLTGHHGSASTAQCHKRSNYRRRGKKRRRSGRRRYIFRSRYHKRTTWTSSPNGRSCQSYLRMAQENDFREPEPIRTSSRFRKICHWTLGLLL